MMYLLFGSEVPRLGALSRWKAALELGDPPRQPGAGLFSLKGDIPDCSESKA